MTIALRGLRRGWAAGWLLAALASFASPPSVAQITPGARVALAEYAVYNAALRASLGDSGASLVIMDVTVAKPLYGDADAQRIERITKDLGLAKACPGAYAAANQRPAEIENGFDLPVDHWLMAQTVFARFFESKPEFGWKRFFDRHPDTIGIVRLSRVGYCREGVNALVYIEHGCGPECGSGRFVSLERGPGGWRVEGVMREWVLTDAQWPKHGSD